METHLTEGELDSPFTIVVDSREKARWYFDGIKSDAKDGYRLLRVKTEVRGLPTGDYSLDGYENKVVVERKNLQDLFGTLGQGRKRFERELCRLSTFQFSAVVVEADWRAITGVYPEPLLNLMQVFLANIAKNDRSQPWSRWVEMLEAAMPGPPEYSQLDPKIVFRTILCWQQRFTSTHWLLCPDRRFAEIATFRVLERFYKDTVSGQSRIGGVGVWRSQERAKVTLEQLAAQEEYERRVLTSEADIARVFPELPF